MSFAIIAALAATVAVSEPAAWQRIDVGPAHRLASQKHRLCRPPRARLVIKNPYPKNLTVICNSPNSLMLIGLHGPSHEGRGFIGVRPSAVPEP